MQKYNTFSSAVDSLSTFGFAVESIPWPALETQDVATRTWPGEHGEDTYIPATGMKFKSFDVEATFCYKGEIDSALSSYNKFRDYLIGLDGEGGILKIYDPYWRKGYNGAYIKKISDFDPNRTNIDESLSFKATFRIADPVSIIGIGVNSNGLITNLNAI